METCRQASHSPTKSKIVQNLKQLITINKEDLENGEVPLCLTPEVLVILNHGFEHLGDTRNGGNKFFNDLNILQQAFNSTQYLRLSHGGNATIQAPVDLAAFTHLRQLDIKRIPIHWVVGLNKCQDRLILIRMCRSINYLEDLLGRCSEPDSLCLAWSKLKKLYLSNNFIKELDESLKLVPYLEVLDLSQNYLTKTGHYLQYLTELVHLNISYNSLTSIPKFSENSKLKTLVLRANHIEQISGIEVLQNLETLDLTSNILCDHGVLLPLHSIPTLTQLYLEENPLSCNPRHRILTGSIMSATVLDKLSLDGHKFSDHEKEFAASIRSTLRLSPQDREGTPTPNGTSSSTVKRKVRIHEVNNIREIPQPEDETDGHEDGKPATVEPSAMSTPSPSSSLRLSQAKTRIETLREEFGDSWLQSFNGCHVPSSRQAYKPNEKDVNSNSPEAKPTASGADIAAPGLSESHKENSNEADSKYGSVEGAYGDNLIDSQYGSVRSSDHFNTDNESTYSAEELANDELDIDYDPFIVKLPVIDADEFLLTFTKKQIVEKSIEGIITEMLDLSALLYVQQYTQSGRAIVKCKFDYFRKDRRERCYVTEDLSDALRLVDILQPIAANSQSTRKTTGIYECLKCGKQFMLKKATKSGARPDCLHCASDMVIELSTVRNAQSTPYGSGTSSLSSSPTRVVTAKAYSEKYSPQHDSVSSNSIYFSTEEPMPSATTRESKSSSLTGSPAKSSTGWASARGSYHTDSEEDGAMGRLHTTASALEISDSVSYQSLSNESDVSVYEEEHVDSTHKLDSLTGLKFDSTDLSYIDHRLKLHLTVSYFEDHEQPQCTLKCKCVEYTKPEEYAAILVLTNSHFYLFRIHSPLGRHLDTGGQTQLVERRLLSDMCYIEIGLAHQNIRVEFDKSGYCLLIRDSSVGVLLQASVSMLMSNSSFNEQSKLKSIGKINQEYYRQISRCLPEFTAPEDDSSKLYYGSAFRKVPYVETYNLDMLKGCRPVSLLVQGSSLYVVKEMYYLPFTRGRITESQHYFTLESTISIQDIASLAVNRDRCEVEIEGFDEQTSNPLPTLIFPSLSSLTSFTNAISLPWKDIYNVDLEISCRN